MREEGVIDEAAPNWARYGFSVFLQTLSHRFGTLTALYPEPGSYDEELGAITFADLRDRAIDTAVALQDIGVGSGDRVAILGENSIRWIDAWFGASLLGAIVVPINTRLTWAEIEFQLREALPKVLLVDEPHPAYSEVVTLVERDVLPRDIEGMTVHWLRPNPTLDIPPLTQGYNVGDQSSISFGEISGAGMLQFTSGSTASPKGALLTQNSMIGVGGANADRWLVGPDDVFLGACPLYHNSGSVFTTLSAFAAGGAVALMSHWSVEQALLVANAAGVTAFAGVDTLIRDLASVQTELLSPLRLVVTAAPPSVCADLNSVLGADVVDVYGLTECAPTVATGDLRDPQQKRIDLIGLPHPGVHVRIVDDKGVVLGPDVQGEIQVSGWNMMLGYSGVAMDRQPFTDDGWLITGDIGSLDIEGYLKYYGRFKDMIKSGGENVSALEVEVFLTNHPDVRDAAVVGIPDQRWVEAVVAFVRLLPGSQLSSEEVVDYCRTGLARFKVPKRVLFLTEWPLTGSGKIAKPILRDIAARSVNAHRKQQH